MSDSDPLYPGQQVFLRRPLQIYGTVVGRPVGDSHRPGDQVRYNIEIMPLEQIYLPEDIELSAQALPLLPRADYRMLAPPPEPPPAPSLAAASVYAPTPAPALTSVPDFPSAPVQTWEAAISPAPHVESINLCAVDSFDGLAQEIHELIARRAYELYTYHGYAHGHDAEDWRHAISELLLSVPTDITETDSQLNIYADLPGVSAQNLEVSILPRAICISATRQTPSAQYGEKSISFERRSNRVFRIFELPCEIHPGSVTASLNAGVLAITLPKVGMRNVIEFRSNANVA